MNLARGFRGFRGFLGGSSVPARVRAHAARVCTNDDRQQTHRTHETHLRSVSGRETGRESS
jgi:hypothetical protein